MTKTTTSGSFKEWLANVAKALTERQGEFGVLTRTNTDGERTLMPRRASRWVIEELDGDRWNLSRGGRQLYGGLPSKQVTLQRLRNHHRPGEPVILEAPDGYRTNITEELKRSGIIRG